MYRALGSILLQCILRSKPENGRCLYATRLKQSQYDQG